VYGVEAVLCTNVRRCWTHSPHQPAGPHLTETVTGVKGEEGSDPPICVTGLGRCERVGSPNRGVAPFLARPHLTVSTGRCAQPAQVRTIETGRRKRGPSACRAAERKALGRMRGGAGDRASCLRNRPLGVSLVGHFVRRAESAQSTVSGTRRENRQSAMPRLDQPVMTMDERRRLTAANEAPAINDGPARCNSTPSRLGRSAPRMMSRRASASAIFQGQGERLSSN